MTSALGAGLLVVAAVGLGGYTAINALVDHSGRVTTTYQALLLFDRIVAESYFTESLQRRYLLSGDPEDYAGYREVRKDVEQAVAQMRATPLQGELRRRFEQLDQAVALRLASLEKSAEARRTEGREAAAAIVVGENRQLGREIDGLAEDLQKNEQGLLGVASASVSREANTSRLTIVLGTMLSLGLLSWAILLIGRYQAEREQVEAQLRESQERSRAITENMADGVITTDEEGTIIEANAAAKALFGHPGEELLGRTLKSLLPQRHRETFETAMTHMRARRGPVREPEREMRVLRKDGSSFYVKASFSDLHAGGKRLFSALIRDTTGRRLITQELKASEAQLREVTDAVPALIAFIDAEGVVRFNNKAYEEYFGLDRSHILGCRLEDVVGREIYERLQPCVAEALAGFPVRYERSHTMPSGEHRDLEGHFFPRYGEGLDQGKVMGFYSLVTDTTALKRVDRMKSEFVSTVSHELRTPLTSIRGSLGLVAGGVAGALPDAARKLVDIAKSNCERLIRLINDILDVEKIESGKMQFDTAVQPMLPLLVQAVAGNEGFAAQHDVRLRFSSSADGATCPIDADRLVQVVTNLLSNAVKFSPPGGTVEMTLAQAGGRARVEVRDQGPGIPLEFRSRIFQKFSQADSSDARGKGGTGLGLNISRSIVERFGGTIGFTSEIGQGTTFFFELPLAQAERTVQISAAQPRVLVCDDDPDIARLIRSAIGSEPAMPRVLHVEDDLDVQQVTAAIAQDFAAFDFASSLAEARTLLAQRHFDLVLLDLALPDGSGESLLQEIRARKPRPRVVIFSASDVDVDGADEILVKSRTSNEELLGAIHRMLARAP